jgi:hypothetical protein
LLFLVLLGACFFFFLKHDGFSIMEAFSSQEAGVTFLSL